jgi:hypothetical protein
VLAGVVLFKQLAVLPDPTPRNSLLVAKLPCTSAGTKMTFVPTAISAFHV